MPVRAAVGAGAFACAGAVVGGGSVTVVASLVAAVALGAAGGLPLAFAGAGAPPTSTSVSTKVSACECASASTDAETSHIENQVAEPAILTRTNRASAKPMYLRDECPPNKAMLPIVAKGCQEVPEVETSILPDDSGVHWQDSQSMFTATRFITRPKSPVQWQLSHAMRVLLSSSMAISGVKVPSLVEPPDADKKVRVMTL
mmetsp:Transcript_17259/g.31448  ORF Transcript_17259/g.31448 Transcript_17259/m.31448 type:complete len:201 (-) Transcript_17259:282-884(-)